MISLFKFVLRRFIYIFHGKKTWLEVMGVNLYADLQFWPLFTVPWYGFDLYVGIYSTATGFKLNVKLSIDYYPWCSSAVVLFSVKCVCLSYFQLSWTHAYVWCKWHDNMKTIVQGVSQKPDCCYELVKLCHITSPIHNIHSFFGTEKPYSILNWLR